MIPPNAKRAAVGFSIAVLLVIAAVFAALRILNPALESTVRIKNVSGFPVAGGELEVCRQRFAVPAIAPDGVTSLRYRASFDSSYTLRVTLASGDVVAGDVGYVSRGAEFDDELFIHSDRVGLSARVVRSPR